MLPHGLWFHPSHVMLSLSQLEWKMKSFEDSIFQTKKKLCLSYIDNPVIRVFLSSKILQFVIEDTV